MKLFRINSILIFKNNFRHIFTLFDIIWDYSWAKMNGSKVFVNTNIVMNSLGSDQASK